MKGQRKIRRRRMHEDLVDVIVEQIRDGTLAVDSELPSERELAEDFGVSRLTVREAMGALERSGLIEVRPGIRARISIPDGERLIDLLSMAAGFYFAHPDGLTALQEARVVVEAGAVRLAAERIDDAGVAALREALERNRADIGDAARFASSDVDFHFAIARIARNDILNGFYQAAGRWLHDMRSVTLEAAEQMEAAHAAHARIFEAIRDRHPEAAGRAMSEHLNQVSSIYPVPKAIAARPRGRDALQEGDATGPRLRRPRQIEEPREASAGAGAATTKRGSLRRRLAGTSSSER